MTSLCLIYSPFPSPEAAESVAKTLITERLVACANIIPGIRSIYEWQEAIETSSEAILLVKTPLAFFEVVFKRIETLHPYDCPCILKMVGEVNTAFLSWAQKQCLVP